MRRRIVGCLLLVALAGCKSYTYSENIVVDATVYDTVFVPAGHGSDIAVGYAMGGNGGMTFTPIDVDIPARYAIVLDFNNRRHIVEGDLAKMLYHQLKRGDAARVVYRRVYLDEQEQGIEVLNAAPTTTETQ